MLQIIRARNKRHRKLQKLRSKKDYLQDANQRRKVSKTLSLTNPLSLKREKAQRERVILLNLSYSRKEHVQMMKSWLSFQITRKKVKKSYLNQRHSHQSKFLMRKSQKHQQKKLKNHQLSKNQSLQPRFLREKLALDPKA